MYSITKEHYGYKLAFSGTILGPEMASWFHDANRELRSAPKNFGVFVDMRDLRPIAEDAQLHMNEGQQLFKDKGMERSVVILNSAVITIQFKRIAKETGIYEWERYINAEQHPDWEVLGVDWIVNGVDPDDK